MDKFQLVVLLRALLEEELTEESRIDTEETGVLNCNAGLVVRLPNGDEFQISVIKSQIGKEEK